MNLSTQTIFLNIFDSDDCAFNIFKRLNVFELKNLALSCKFFNKKVKDYLGSDEKIWQRLMTGFFVDRAFVDKAPVEAFKVMFNYIFRMRDRHINNENVNLTSIFDIISNEQENSLGSNSELKSILSFFGVMRKATSMEIVVYASAKLLKDTFRNYHMSHNSTDIEKLPLTCFRVGVEAFSLPVLLLIFDLVLTGKEENISQLKIENIKSLLFKCLAINSVREKMCDFKTITPFHAVLSNEASLTCSKSLLSLLNRCGISFSYSKDLKDGKLSRILWNSFGVRSAMQNTKSNMHWIECDNLETMLKTTSIHNAERLTHFLTSQLEYVECHNTVIDLHEKQPSHLVKSDCFDITEFDSEIHQSFVKRCMKKCSELQSSLQCEDLVSALAQSSNVNNSDVSPNNSSKSKGPSLRILNNDNLLPMSSSVYLRMEKLCSSNIHDIKKLLDLTADDYNLNKLCYIPHIACSPLLFVSPVINSSLIKANFDGQCNFPLPYLLHWGFVSPKENADCIGNYANDLDLKHAVGNAADKLKNQSEGIYIASNLIKAILQQSDYLHLSKLDNTILNTFLAELLRKQGHLIEANKIFLQILAKLPIISTKDNDSILMSHANENIIQQLLENLLINVACNFLQLGQSKECIELLDKSTESRGTEHIDKYLSVCKKYIISCAQASLGNFSIALQLSLNVLISLKEILPNNHSIVGIVYNQLGILFTINNESEQGNDNLCKALAIFLQTTGEKSFLYLTTHFNQILIECITKFAVSKLDILREAVHALANIFPANHQLVTFLNAENLIRELSNQDTKFQGTFL